MEISFDREYATTQIMSLIQKYEGEIAKFKSTQTATKPGKIQSRLDSVKSIKQHQIDKQRKLLQSVDTNSREIIIIDITNIHKILIEYIRDLLRYMSPYDLYIIFNNLREDILKIKKINYNVIANLKEKVDRLIIFVDSIELIDGTIIQIQTSFFKSSGTSRSAGCTNCWIPTNYFDCTTTRISKEEDKYLTDIEMFEVTSKPSIIKQQSYINQTKLTEINEIITNFEEFKTLVNNLLRYGRFINNNIALASIILYWLDKSLPDLFIKDVKDLTIETLKSRDCSGNSQINFSLLKDPAKNRELDFEDLKHKGHNIVTFYDTNTDIQLPTLAEDLYVNSIISRQNLPLPSNVHIYSFNNISFALNSVKHLIQILEILVNMYNKLSSTDSLAGGHYDIYYKKYIKYKTKYLELKN
jgi:hypothetical protein